VQDRRTRAAEALGGGLCAFGAALATAPDGVLALAGIRGEQGTAPLFARLVGVRDLAFGAAVLGTRNAATRRRLLRLVAGICFADTLLLLLGRGRLPGRGGALGAAASALTGAQALWAATGEGELETGGVPLLVAGYLLSTAPTLRLAPIVRERKTPAFAAFEAGAALIGLGWLRRGNRGGATINLGAALGAAAWWLWQLRSRTPAAAG